MTTQISEKEYLKRVHQPPQPPRYNYSSLRLQYLDQQRLLPEDYAIPFFGELLGVGP